MAPLPQRAGASVDVPAGVSASVADLRHPLFLLTNAFLAAGARTTPPEPEVDTDAPGLGLGRVVIEGGCWRGVAGAGRTAQGVDVDGAGLAVRFGFRPGAETVPSFACWGGPILL